MNLTLRYDILGSKKLLEVSLGSSRTWGLDKSSRSLGFLSLKVWRSFGISCFSCVAISVLEVNGKG